MSTPNAKLSDPKYKKWDGRVLIWYQQRKRWLKDESVTSFNYRYKDSNNVVNELEISKESLYKSGVFFEGRWKTRADGTRYYRPAFFAYKASEVEILEHRIIVKERK